MIFLDTCGFAYKRFVDILETFDFIQHIDKPTHNSGHLLDYIITRKGSSGVSNLYVSDFICDNRALHVALTCSRAHPERKQIEVRSQKCIQCENNNLFKVQYPIYINIRVQWTVHKMAV